MNKNYEKPMLVFLVYCTLEHKPWQILDLVTFYNETILLYTYISDEYEQYSFIIYLSNWKMSINKKKNSSKCNQSTHRYPQSGMNVPYIHGCPGSTSVFYVPICDYRGGF